MMLDGELAGRRRREPDVDHVAADRLQRRQDDAVEHRPETRLSRPTTIFFEPPLLDAHAPKAAAYCATTSGVSASPTRPRIPETLTIKPSCDIQSPSS